MKAVARKFIRRNIIPKVASLCALGQKVSDEAAELLLRSGDVFTAVKESRKFGVIVLVGNEREGL